MKNKKASVLDVLLIVIFLFGFAVAFLVVHYTWGRTVTYMKNTTAINQSVNAVAVLDSSVAVSDKLDYVLFGTFMGMLIALVITSFLVAGHPIWTFIFTLVDIIIIVVAAVLSYVWNTLVSKAMFTSTLAKFPITNHLLNNFPIYVAILALVSLAIMYAKPYLAGDSR